MLEMKTITTKKNNFEKADEEVFKLMNRGEGNFIEKEKNKEKLLSSEI